MNNVFRVWDGVRMWYSREASEDGDYREFVLGMDGTLMEHSLDPLRAEGESIDTAAGEVMHSTGRTVKDADGNERELYDGDIVEWRPEQSKPMICEISQKEDSGAFMMHITWGWLPLAVNKDNTTILGNKYENPELVDKETKCQA